MDREQLIDEVLMLLPALMRLVGRPGPVEMGEIARRGIPVDAHISPGHVQILISLSRGPRSVGQLAEDVGVSPPAATQLIDKLVEHGMVERRHDHADRRVVLVDYVPGMHEVARRIMEDRRKPIERTINSLTDEEARAFVKGLKLMTEGLGTGPVES
ncbi:MAG TPA: MarR family transcriptional regulator [Rubrobacteraceae bacterium]|nr:MarR family transcriptional regulator [Rubrobacteraceae bacterium]